MGESNGKPTAPKPPRLGRGPAFGSDYGGGMDVRTYVATALCAATMIDSSVSAEHAAAAAVRFADALILELAK